MQNLAFPFMRFICSLSKSWPSRLATNVYDYIHDNKKKQTTFGRPTI